MRQLHSDQVGLVLGVAIMLAFLIGVIIFVLIRIFNYEVPL